MFLQNYEEDIKWNLAGTANHNIFFLRYFQDTSFINPFPSSPFVITDDNAVTCMIFGDKTIVLGFR